MSPRNKRRAEEPPRGAVELMEEAQHLVRTAPLSVLAAYFVGTVPFVLALLYFWADMSRSAFAFERCLPAAVGLALLFLWMKCWHTVYAAGLRDHLAGVPPEPWTGRRIRRTVALQSAVQPFGLVLIPLAMLLAFPFYAVYAFYQNVTALGDGRDDGEAVRSARRLAMLWPRQNHIVLWMVSPWVLGLGMLMAFGFTAMMFTLNPEIAVDNSLGWMLLSFLLMYLFLFPFSPVGTLVAANIAVVLMVGPSLVLSLSGVETTPVLAGPTALLNTTFVGTVWALSYLVLDPVAKAAYVLRCFYGASRTTGEDLRAQLRTLTRPAAALLVAFAAWSLPPAVRAEETPAGVDPTELSASIDQVMAQPEYAWRMARERPEVLRENKSILVRFVEGVADMIEAGFDKIRHTMERMEDWMVERIGGRDREAGPWSPDWLTPVRLLWITALALVLGFGLFFAYRAWRARRGQHAEETEALPPAATADLLTEAAVASALPSDEWMRLARACLARGEWRLAIHAMFLACLADLGAFQWLTIAPYKSNGAYLHELRRRAAREPAMLQAFTENMAAFECTWYGDHEVTEQMLRMVERNREVIARDAAPA